MSSSEDSPNKSRTPSPKKAVKLKSANVKKPSHPPTSVMVTAAINELNERKGSSLSAIKKYISGTYEVDVEKLAPFIKKHIKKSVESGDLVQTSGKGATGSFKFPPKTKQKKAAPKEKSSESENESEEETETPPKVTVRAPKKVTSPEKNKEKVKKEGSKAKSTETKKSKKPAEPKKKVKATVKSPKKTAKPKSPKKQAAKKEK